MKILFIGDYSNLHSTLARELRREGHKVDVMSDGCGFMDTPTDIFIERKPGILGGFRYLYDLFNILPQIKGYDVVQLINTNFLSLRPGKIKYFFDRIKAQNGSVFLTLAGNDYYFVKACHDAKLFRFSEFKIGEEPTEFQKTDPNRMYGWISDANRRLADYLYGEIDGAMSVLPEYDMASKEILGEKLTFTNLPLILSDYPFTPLDLSGKIRVFIGMKENMKIQKGTKYLLTVSKELERELPDLMEVECVSNLPLKEYTERMKGSHIVLDQFYSYSPGMNALQAMAMGKVAGTGGEKEYYEYIGEPEEKPIFNLSPFSGDTKERLRELVLNKDKLDRMSKKGRELVEMHNDSGLVAKKFINHWERIISKK